MEKKENDLHLLEIINDRQNYFPLKDTDQTQIQQILFEKQQFYQYIQTQYPSDLTTEQQLHYIKDKCMGLKKLRLHQIFLQKLINENTPYRALLCFHHVGTGKTLTAITIAENIMDYVKKHRQRIVCIVPGPLGKQSWKQEIIQFVGYKYAKGGMNQKQLWKLIKNNYQLVTRVAFAELVELTGEQTIFDVNNTLVIIDEVHAFPNTSYGEALIKLLQRSTNVRLLLLTATPIKNRVDDIIEIINYLQLAQNRNFALLQKKDFFDYGQYVEEIRPKSKEKIQQLRQYLKSNVSFFGDFDPYVYPVQVQMGNEIVDSTRGALGLMKVTQCKLSPFQLEAYNYYTSKEINDLGTGAVIISNFVLPMPKGNQVVPIYKQSKIKHLTQFLKNEQFLKNYINQLRTKFHIEPNDLSNFIYINNTQEEDMQISGLIFSRKYVHHFSCKMAKILEIIDSSFEKFDPKEGSDKSTRSVTIFIYSNYKFMGVDVIQQVLEHNGIIKFREDQNYSFDQNTVDYRYGIAHHQYQLLQSQGKVRDKFKPATYIKLSGSETSAGAQQAQQSKELVSKYFNQAQNINGQIIKILLGSKVIAEGLTVANGGISIKVDSSHNLTKMIQVDGRTCRFCQHSAKQLHYKEPIQTVKMYNLVSCTDFYKPGKPYQFSLEEQMIYKSYKKYEFVAPILRMMKEEAIDCPFQHAINVFRPLKLPGMEEERQGSVQCDLQDCMFKCSSKELEKYFDQAKKQYQIEQHPVQFSNINFSEYQLELEVFDKVIQFVFKIHQMITLGELIRAAEEVFTNISSLNIQNKNIFIIQILEQYLVHNSNDARIQSKFIKNKWGRLCVVLRLGDLYFIKERDRLNLDDFSKNYIEIAQQQQFTDDQNSNFSLATYLHEDPSQQKMRGIRSDVEQGKYDYEYYNQCEFAKTFCVIFQRQLKIKIQKQQKQFAVNDTTLPGIGMNVISFKFEFLEQFCKHNKIEMKVKTQMAKRERKKQIIISIFEHFLNKELHDQLTWLIVSQNVNGGYPLKNIHRVNIYKKLLEQHKAKFEISNRRGTQYITINNWNPSFIPNIPDPISIKQKTAEIEIKDPSLKAEQLLDLT